MRVGLAVLVIAIVSASLAIGLIWSREPVGAFFGLLGGFGSAVFWALGSLARPPWNARFNLFAALLAAASLGFLAPADRVCGWHQMPLICQ